MIHKDSDVDAVRLTGAPRGRARLFQPAWCRPMFANPVKECHILQEMTSIALNDEMKTKWGPGAFTVWARRV